ncbi:hypothetical protein SAMD00023353_2700040 [Rosellinia necatrix]|uniref:Prenylated rab acceptor 1 n=1 Tax=Rosellinia necatrix TaxID=77044 RepID=A0A1W2TH13_ROSNE|nr:hypothetical protein SAMD00023353_2700040 [Rosellinia necatrix]
MGFFDGWGDGASVVSRKSHKSHKHRKRDKSRSGSHSRDHGKHRSSSGLEGLLGEESNYSNHNASRGSFFNLANNSTRSFFSTGRSPSYYKRSPRSNFMTRAYKKLKRLLRDLVYWAKRHPVKVFMLVIMPLITGGALTALLARFGLRLPAGIQRMLGLAAKTAGGGGSIGLMGEAVRMATGLGGNSSADLGYGEGLHYEKRRTEYTDYSGGKGGGGGGGFFSGIGKFFS